MYNEINDIDKTSLLLYMETSGDECSIAIADHRVVHVLVSTDKKRSHIQRLSPLIDNSLKKLNLRYQDLKAIVVCAGPGSYTGLRVGYATAKSLCYSLEVPMIEVSLLASLAYSIPIDMVRSSIDLIIASVPARKGECYVQIFDRDLLPLSDGKAISIDDVEVLNAMIESKSKSLCLVGPGSALLQMHLLLLNNWSFVVHPHDFHISHMLPIGRTKYIQEDFTDIRYATPNYIKPAHITQRKKPLL